MAFLTMISAGLADSMNTPSGMWEWLILHLFDFVANYGWRIVLFTILLKLVLLPLDIYQKYCMRKNQRITQRLEPELEKLKKACGDDKQAFAQKQMALNKREGFSYFSSCLPMILTMVIFIWLWQSMSNISRYMILRQYVEWNDRYNTVYGYLTDENFFESESSDATTEAEREQVRGYVVAAIDNYNLTVADANKVSSEDARPGMGKEWSSIESKDIVDYVAGQAVADYYGGEESNRESFLWIANVWTAEVPWKKPIGDYSTFIQSIGKYASNASKLGLDDVGTVTASDRYALVTSRLAVEQNRPNGYLVLPILSVGVSFLSYFITQRQQKKSGQVTEGMTGGGTMKVMMLMMPLMMGFFALTYSSAFTLYIVVNSSSSVAVNLLSSLMLNLKDKHDEKKAVATVHRHGRPDPNADDKNKK